VDITIDTLDATLAKTLTTFASPKSPERLWPFDRSPPATFEYRHGAVNGESAALPKALHFSMARTQQNARKSSGSKTPRKSFGAKAVRKSTPLRVQRSNLDSIPGLRRWEKVANTRRALIC
jgi:hypothetical protein